MDVPEYRKQVAADIEKASREQTSLRDMLGRARPAARAAAPTGAAEGLRAAAGEDDLAAAVAVLRDKDEDPGLRAQVLAMVGDTLGAEHALIDAMLGVLGDDTEPPELRKAALAALQRASFIAAVFAPKRPEFLATLRGVIDDEDAELRRRAIGVLAREKDEYVQRRLIEGLEHRAKALVPAAKAIQFLGYDIHAEHFSLLRQIIRHPPTRAAKKEAIRLLGADPSAKALLAEILADKGEKADVRKVSAVALQSLDPDRFEALARRIALDEAEDDGLRATCISALTHFGSPATFGREGAFTRGIEAAHEKAGSRQMKRATATYLSKYGG